MVRNVEVSIVVLTYNPDLQKTLHTLKSIIVQKGVNTEIIISDDGSEVDYHHELEDFLEKNEYNPFRLIKNEKNIGTVANILGAIKQAKGKYIYLISPGDMLYDEGTIKGLLSYIKEKDAKVAFGNAVFYRINHDEKPQIFSSTANPAIPQIYNYNSNFLKIVGFFSGGYILGASILRERQTAIQYFEKLIGKARYMEDNTSTLLLLNDRQKIVWFNQNVVFYESGVGISTSTSKEWEKILEDEFKSVIMGLKSSMPCNAIYESVKMNYAYAPSKKRKIMKFLRHPIVSVLQIYFYSIPKKRTTMTEIDIEKLDSLVKK